MLPRRHRRFPARSTPRRHPLTQIPPRHNWLTGTVEATEATEAGAAGVTMAIGAGAAGVTAVAGAGAVRRCPPMSHGLARGDLDTGGEVRWTRSIADPSNRTGPPLRWRAFPLLGAISRLELPLSIVPQPDWWFDSFHSIP